MLNPRQLSRVLLALGVAVTGSYGAFHALRPTVVRADGAANTNPGGGVALDELRCERLGGGSLGDLKLKMLQYCNIDKPFSIAGADSPMNSSYTYCCHKK